MAVERKKNRRKIDEEIEKTTKEEYAVAKYLRFSCPVRQGRLVGMTVQCFFANKAIDTLLESKWSSTKTKNEPLFTNRASCVSYCNRLLQKGLFHRAEKVERKKDKDKPKRKKKIKEGEKEEESGEEQKKGKKDKKAKKEKDDGSVEKAEEEEAEKKEEKKDEEKKKKEKKLKLNMHDDQRFLDGEEVYVWIYDPVPLKTFLIGLLMVFGAIALCLFPLWPEEVRVAVYYISLAAAGFVGFILSLVVVRIILFSFIWVFTLGKHHFWFLPNLTEDVGFFDSFKPLYKHDVTTKEKEKTKEKSTEKKTKDTDKGEKEKVKDKSSDDKEESASEKSENGEFELVDKDDIEESGSNINEAEEEKIQENDEDEKETKKEK